ncbi:MAG TPA: hypothetical protein VIM41_08135 [Gammaproteobacteria bacterium]
MGNEAKLAIPALVTICLEDVDVVRAVAMDAINRIAPNLEIYPLQKIYANKRNDSTERKVPYASIDALVVAQ